MRVLVDSSPAATPSRQRRSMQQGEAVGARFLDVRTPFLVLGVGSYAYGRERRAARAFRHMHRINPYFLIPKWGDGSVAQLLTQYGHEYELVPVGYIGWRRPGWAITSLLHLPQLCMRVLRAYRRRRCRGVVILDIQVAVAAAVPLLLLRVLSRASLVCYLGDIPSDTWLNRMLVRILGGQSEQIVGNSEAVRRGLVTLGMNRERIAVIHNGVDLSLFSTAKPLSLDSASGWLQDSVLVGYIGQFSDRKGVWDFVYAAERIARLESRCRFLMVGTSHEHDRPVDRLRDYLRAKKLEDLFFWTGKVEEVERVYAALDIVVVPSRYEDPAPNVVIEALASGTPVVGTRAGGIPELLEDGDGGFLVPPGEPQAIADRVVALARDPEVRRVASVAASARARRLFDIRRNALRLEAVILSAVEA